MKATILIIEDDDMINNMIKEAFELAGYTCIQAFSGTEGLLHVKTLDVDLVILDLMLPGKCGEEVIKEIKAYKQIPVIIVSAKDGIDSKVELLRSGADDYLTKPFDIKELEVRAEVRIRRYRENSHNSKSLDRDDDRDENSIHETDTESGLSKSTALPNDHRCGNSIFFKEIELNPTDYFIKVNGITLDFTKHEFRIMELLMKNPDRAFSKQAIYDFAWDDVYLGEDNTINVHISNIRKKIKKYSDTEYIETVWGIGFKLKR